MQEFIALSHAIEIRGENAQRQERTKSKLKPTIDVHGLPFDHSLLVFIVTRASFVFVGN